MKLLVPDTSKLNREQFLAARKGKIGSSDVPAMVGMHPYCSKQMLFARLTGKAPDVQESREMRLGIRREEDVATEYGIEAGKKVQKVNQIWAHDVHAWAIATPDYYVIDTQFERNVPRLLECKTTKARMMHLWDEGIPEYAHLQVQWQMGIGGVSKAVVACLSGDNELVYYQTEFRPNAFQILLNEAGEFMRHVERDVPPKDEAPDLKALQAIYREIRPEKTVDLYPVRLAVEQWERACKSEKAASEDVKKYKGLIRQHMKDAPVGTLDGKVRVKISTVERAGYTVEATSYEQMKLVVAK